MVENYKNLIFQLDKIESSLASIPENIDTKLANNYNRLSAEVDRIIGMMNLMLIIISIFFTPLVVYIIKILISGQKTSASTITPNV